MTRSTTSVGIRQSPRPEAGLHPHYVALFWLNSESGEAAADRLTARGAREARGFEPVLRAPGLLILGDTTDPRGQVRRQGGRILIGERFERAGCREHAEAPGGWCPNIWGAFVSFEHRPDGSVQIVRDPSGGQHLYLTQKQDLLVASNAFPSWLREALNLDIRCDLHQLAAALADPLRLTYASPLTGICVVPAGCTCEWRDAQLGPVTLAWRPHALRGQRSGMDIADASARLRSAVIESCRAFATRHDRLAIEVSGGLDSAIVLGAIASAPNAPEITCVHFHVEHSGGDERDHARAVAERWGVRLVEVGAKASDFRFEDALQEEQPLEPVIFGLDPLVEGASLGVGHAVDATAILTGQGGDAVFLNSPSPWTAVDRARAQRLATFASRVPLETALRAGTTIWHIYRLLLTDMVRSRREAPAYLPGGHLTRFALEARLRTEHPWLEHLAALPPGRRDQLRAIANCQHFNSPTARGAFAPLIHPLLSQPVTETCLTIPTWMLAHGTINRALARQTFADWLPAGLRLHGLPPVRSEEFEGPPPIVANIVRVDHPRGRNWCS
ncbi:asparagine synthase [Sphingomonas koreensis]|jgi:asparagine synthase (glutamine-hydrolysing)|uniref:Asparagine synthase n=2 Tax=Sphingomonas koreensis TaxID=93064 RepID=A0AAJ4S3D2_9SPHN|nr:asparagine synthase C-terminal domain-containing protein [Sphingomonas koreensis]RSU17101.1 asparagine synthase [Sphingomonas koreensis]RSU20053.1 asparagine synthase [Sphingomonas koreensis]RSU22017.1 asparagine synthase [Sphingomonas koreensis]RSU31732.1 asparagine synthase [Sphingomonas koreensis]RSU34874.1 asparagine synthase [Sphingomonas koreensis]